MTTEITFETATIADCLKKAARVAPTKSGHAFDKAAGVVIDVFPDSPVKCVVKATNIDVFYAEILGCVSASGPEVRWRLPSSLLERVIGTLPLRNGSVVKFTQKSASQILVTSGRMKATMNLMDSTYYPDWDMFDPSDATPVAGLGGRITQVEWAAASDGKPPLCGVFMNGSHLIATDRYILARVPCLVDIPRPALIPSGILGGLLKQMGDVGLHVSNLGLHLSPDDYTQISTVIFDSEYPDVTKVMQTTHKCTVEVGKNELVDKITRASQFSGADRAPLLRIIIGQQELAVMMENAEVGVLGDVMELPGQAVHKRSTILFTPKNLLDALSHAPNNKVKIGYDDEAPTRPVYIDGGSGYECWVVPRKIIGPSA